AVHDPAGAAGLRGAEVEQAGRRRGHVAGQVRGAVRLSGRAMIFPEYPIGCGAHVRMGYRLLADLIVAIHAAYVAFVVVGLLLILIGLACGWKWVRNWWFRVAHLVAILIVAAE